jgi:selenoprotein W-related protein
LAAKILELKQRLGAVRLVPGEGGAFEVSLNGELLHSKLQNGEFPDFDKLVKTIRGRL